MRAGPIRRTLAALLVGATAAATGVASPGEAQAAPLSSSGGRPPEVRIATFNASLNRTATGELIDDLSSPDNAQAATVAEIIQRVRPDLLLINEFDFDPDGTAAELFQQNYLSVPHNGAAPIEYPYHFVAPSNTGIPSGFDLNNDGSIGGPDDALGFGFFPGQFGMAVYSMHPIVLDDVRTFQTFLWADMPAAVLPDDPATAAPGDWFSAAELGAVRLSSKSHWDLPIDIDGRIVHFLVSHPTPPVFDHPRVNTSVTPSSDGAVAAAARQGGANLTHRGDPAFDTADFADSAPGNLRVDYVLPSRPLRIVGAGVFWPTADDPLFRLVGDFPFPSSDHRLTWVDVTVPGGPRR